MLVPKHEDLDSNPGNPHDARHPDVPLNPSDGQMGGQDRQILVDCGSVSLAKVLDQ